MKIATNIPALQAKISISKSSNASSSASDKLSSGLRINTASDDATGMAISARMKTQIRGSSRAGKNALDGISLVQTADGALQEVHNMLQRMRELSIQAANSTYTLSDLKKIQIEIDELKDEINSVSEKTEFNKLKLFDGSADLHSMGINTDVLSVSSTVKTGEYKFKVLERGETALYVPGSALSTQLAFPDEKLSGTITINDYSVEIEDYDTRDSVLNKIIDLAKECGLEAIKSVDGSSIESIEAIEAGSKYTIEISSANKLLLDALGMNSSALNIPGTDAEVELIRNANDPTSVISDSAAYTADGNRITILDINNQKLVADIKAPEQSAVENHVSALRKEIAARWNIVDKAHDDISNLYTQIGSVTNAAGINNIADQLLALESLALTTSEQAKNLMFDAVNLFPVLTTLPTYGPELSNLTFHDSHYVDFFNDSAQYLQDAKDKAATGDIAGARNDLISAFSIGTGSKSGGGGVGGCSFEIVNSALNIVKDTMQLMDNQRDCVIDVTDGGLILQVGANEGMQMKLQISKVTTQTLDIDDMEITTIDKAQQAIMKCDYAIGRISDIRAMVGSYANRLNYTELNLSSIELNLTTSLSVIQDADLAYEMAESTRNNVLQQAGMFVLSQANQKPQEMLQLLK